MIPFRARARVGIPQELSKNQKFKGEYEVACVEQKTIRIYHPDGFVIKDSMTIVESKEVFVVSESESTKDLLCILQQPNSSSIGCYSFKEKESGGVFEYTNNGATQRSTNTAEFK